MESRLSPQEAQAVLAAVRQSRSDMADRLITPWWYHPLLGVLVGGLITVTFGGLSMPVVTGVLIVYAAGLTGLVFAYRRKAGVWVSGFEGGPRSRRSMTRFLVFAGTLAIVGAFFSMGMEIRWVAPLTGLAIAVALTIWGRRFDDLLRADLRESA